jgi:hypothetical protein
MQQAGVDEFHAIADSFPVKTRKHGSGGSSVKTLVVIKNSDAHAFSLARLPAGFDGQPVPWLDIESK